MIVFHKKIISLFLSLGRSGRPCEYWDRRRKLQVEISLPERGRPIRSGIGAAPAPAYTGSVRLLPQALAVFLATAPPLTASALEAGGLRDDFRPPVVMQPSGDLVFDGLVYWRNRNPNGEIDWDGSTPGVVRLGVRKGAYEAATAGGGAVADRSELREANARQQPSGTPVWYRFGLRIPADFPDTPNRFVAAQMKAPFADVDAASPVLAIRVENRRLFATVEQSYDAAANAPPIPVVDGRCPTGTALASRHDSAEYPQIRVLLATSPDGLPPRRLSEYVVCTPVAQVETFGPLPAVGDGWIELTLFIQTGRQGRIELYADGRPVAAVTGALGDANPRERQYFKIGPYRNKAAEPAALEFRRFRRGATQPDLDR